MAIICEVSNVTYSIHRNFTTVTVDLTLKDDSITDESGNPKILDQKTISVTQNVLVDNALELLLRKIMNEIQVYLQNAKVNMDKLDALFGTHDPDQILAAIQNNIQENTNNLVSSIFGA